MKGCKKGTALLVLMPFVLGLASCGTGTPATTGAGATTGAPATTGAAAGTTGAGTTTKAVADGTYQAEGLGFGGKMKVSVKLQDGKIGDVVVDQNFDTPGVGQVALEIVADRIVEGQSTKVDAVTGATWSSQSLMNTVRKALKDAGVPDDQFAKEYHIKRDIQAERSADVVIIGGGGTGLAAAVTAADAGASVIVLEVNGIAGGNLVVSGGVYNTPAPELQGPQGIEDSPELYKKQTLEGGDNVANPDLVETLAVNAHDGYLWLKEIGVEFVDKVIQAPGALHPRSINTTAPLGTGLINAYLHQLENYDKAEILYETKAVSLIQENGRVTGVKATNPDGSELTVKASKGVIIATGGFSKNSEMVMEYRNAEKWPQISEKSVSTNMSSIQGDGIRMAQAVGADVVDMDQMQFLYLGTPKTGLLSGVFNVSAELTIFVNQQGNRFVAEDQRRDVISSAVFAQTDGMMYMLHSADSLKDPATQVSIDGVPMKELLDTGAYGWKQGKTLEELAAAIGVPAENLVKTVADYNQAVDSQVDPFGRKLLKLKMETGPFYALPRVPALHHTMGGIRIDTKAHVLDKSGNIIPGLYAGGEVTGGVHGGNRLGGNAVTETVVFGKIAGLSAASGE